MDMLEGDKGVNGGRRVAVYYGVRILFRASVVQACNEGWLPTCDEKVRKGRVEGVACCWRNSV